MKNKKKKKSLLRRYKMGTNRKVLPKYQTGFVDSGTFGWETDNFPTAPVAQTYTMDPMQSNAPTTATDTTSMTGDPELMSGSPAEGGGGGVNSGAVSSGIATGLNAIAGGLDMGTEAIKANTRSEIDPSSIYAYDTFNSRWMDDKNAAKTTSAITGGIGSVASAIPGGEIIGAGFNVGSAGTDMGLADMERRLIRGHDAMYAQRKNVGGQQGDFTTQGQFTTYNERDTQQPLGKMGGYLDKYGHGHKMQYMKGGSKLPKEVLESRLESHMSEAEASNYLDKYRGGGLYANIHRKRARIKAGSGETMRKKGAKGAPSDANFTRAAKTAKKGMGGYLDSYMGGGYRMPSYQMGTQVGIAQEVPRDMANAEVEGGGGNKRGETIYNAMDGTMDVVMGKKHSKTKEAGVPVVLQEGTPAEGGDFVFSDYLEITDPKTGQKMSVADFSLKYKDDPRMLEYAAQEQSRVSDNKNKKKYGGMLKQYQQGTPTLTQAEIDALNALQGAGTPPSFMQRQQAAQTSQAPATYQAAAAQAQQQVAAQIAQSKAQTASQSFAARSANIPIGTPPVAPTPTSPSAYTKQRAKLASSQAAALQAAKKTANAAYTQAQYRAQGLNAAGQPYTAANFSGLNITQPKGKKGKKAQASATNTASTAGGTNQYGKRTTGQKILDYAPEIGAGLAGLTQIIGKQFVDNPYENVDIPQARQINLPNQYFDRVSADSEIASTVKTAANAIEAGKQIGMPMEGFQKIVNTEAELIAKAEERARNTNVSIDAAEKQLRASNEYKEQSFNAEQLAAADAARLENELNRKGFDSAMTAQTVEDVAGVISDASQYASDFRTSNVIYGNENIRQRASNYDPAAAKEQIMKDYPRTTNESDFEYNERIRKLQNKFAAQFFAQNNIG